MKNLLLLIIIFLILVVFYFNKNEYFQNSNLIKITDYNKDLSNLQTSLDDFNNNLAILDGKINSLQTIDFINKIDTLKKILEPTKINDHFKNISKNIDILYKYELLKDPTDQQIV